jgi:hypothetical protein
MACLVIPKTSCIEGDWGGISPSQACEGLNHSQSTPNLLLKIINKQGLVSFVYIVIKDKTNKTIKCQSTVHRSATAHWWNVAAMSQATSSSRPTSTTCGRCQRLFQRHEGLIEP